MTESHLRASALTFTDAPDPTSGRGYRYLSDAVLTFSDGRISALVSADDFSQTGGDLTRCEHFPGGLMLPGFIDAHVHAPQLGVMASYGRQLLGWLENYTFPAEARFADESYADRQMERFLQALFAHGTTAAMVFSTVHTHAADALFEAAARRNMCLIGGKVITDRNVPAVLSETLDEGSRATRDLIERWHGEGRLRYAVTPRFAITSTSAQLRLAGEMLSAYPDVYLQTHLSENLLEVEETGSLFPEATDYVDVYDRHGLCGPRSVFAHGIHLSERELDVLAARGCTVAFCPTSNLFLGSGLLDVARLRRHGVAMAVATDVGAGTSVSMLSTLAEGYKVLQLQGQSWHPLQALYSITLGNARALQLDAHIGSLCPGKDADLVIIDPSRSFLLAARLESCASIEERLFAMIMLGDDRIIRRTYVAGVPVFDSPAPI
jgi:guanine deaminase